MTLVGNQAADILALTDLIAGHLAAAELMLYQADVNPERGTDPAAYVVANYTGYALKVLTWAAPSVSDDGNVETQAQPTAFRPTGTTVTNLIYGVTIRETVTGTLLFAARFDGAPLPMASALDVIITTIRLRYTAGGLVAVVT